MDLFISGNEYCKKFYKTVELSYMLQEIFFAYWFFIPVGLATLAAFFSGKLTFLKKFSYPIDGYKTFRGKRILGSHKTIRGFLAGIIVAIVTVYIQVFLYKHSALLRSILPIDYNSIDPLVFGFLCGFGSLAGDAVKSFFKRQKNIKPGVSWVPFDQIDQVLGGIFFTWFYLPLSFIHYIFIIIIWFLIHPLTTFFGYAVRLKKKPL
jgi:hypothetical protein